MAKRGVKKQEHEKLDDATVGRVVSLLEQDKPITKKVACETLNIKYNTKRLNDIIQEYKDRQEFKKKMRANKKGTAFSDIEIKEIVTDYLNGESISSIADSLYRSAHAIRKKIDELHLPERSRKPTYQNPDLIPDEAAAKEFEIGELVWAARYNAVAEIRGVYIKTHEIPGTTICAYNDIVYRIWVFGKHNESAYQPWWELGKLEAVKRFNLEPKEFIKTEKPTFQYRVDDEGRTIR
jgi:hypothetical protein